MSESLSADSRDKSLYNRRVAIIAGYVKEPQILTGPAFSTLQGQREKRFGNMGNTKGALSIFALVVFVSFIAVSCGTQQSQLQALEVNPAIADAQNFSGGKVQFTATGHYEHPTRVVTPQPVTWVACRNGTPTADVSVSGSGMAQCAGGAAGQFSINAWDARSARGVSNCTAVTACGGGCTIEASAQLNCP